MFYCDSLLHTYLYWNIEVRGEITECPNKGEGDKLKSLLNTTAGKLHYIMVLTMGKKCIFENLLLNNLSHINT